MKRIVLAIALVLSVWALQAQSSDFTKAFEACIKVNDGFADEFANVEQLTAAANTLSNLKIGQLPITLTKDEKQSLNGHLLFDPEFIKKAIKDKKVYEMAEEYKRRALVRGTGPYNVLMTTIVIPAGKTYKYEMKGCTGEVQIGCVAETNGLFSWKLITETMNEAKTTKTYRDNADEKIGRIARQAKVNADSRYKIILEIKNTSKHDSSFAIIAN